MPVTINGTTGIAGVDGSAGTPAIQGSDTNTGIRFGTDTVGLVTGGSDRLFIDSSGRVGIGTGSPNSLLHISGNNGIRFGAGSTPEAEINYTSAGNEFFDLKCRGTNGTVGNIRFFTGNTSSAAVERMIINNAGNVGIGTTSPEALLDISASAPELRISSSNSAQTSGSSVGKLSFVTSDPTTPGGAGVAAFIETISSTSNGSDYDLVISKREGSGGGSCVITLGTSSTGAISFATNTSGSGTERARIDSSGRLLVGTSSTRTLSGVNAQIQLEGTSENTASQSFIINANTTGGVSVTLGKTRGTSIGGTTVVNNGDDIGTIRFSGSDGTSLLAAALIRGAVDGTPGTNDMPGRLVFSTTADGASGPTERMRISNNGRVNFGSNLGTSDVIADNVAGIIINSINDNRLDVSRDGGASIVLNRKTDDGNLINFHQDGTLEGAIAVSGTTVSLNGAHLSRWSQFPSGIERTEILRGTVLSNIDEMCEWGDEENEQLNRMKVSDVEADKNVSGVFQAWDDEDDTYINDFCCAMTGDFIIRIGSGVTVERGDLLMSAGDGTAKPQGDGYVQDKTIAKVTSTHVTCTYDDGSYCVPCVLMAC